MYKSKKPYFYGTGRRKSSVARVHLFPNGTGSITINGRDIDDYFGLETLKLLVRQPLVTTEQLGKVDIVATVTGGGVTGQAGAIRHGVARALLLANEEYRPALKAAGLLTRDPRMKERKKYGLKAARRAPQFSQALIFSDIRQKCRPVGAAFFYLMLVSTTAGYPQRRRLPGRYPSARTGRSAPYCPPAHTAHRSWSDCIS